MAVFDLTRFRDLAFGREPLPDHPMRDEVEARKLLALLPEDDPDHSLAELTNWAATMNATETFTPGRRARVLMELDAAALSFWRALAARFLAPGGRPSEGRDGDPAILRALFDSASEFANGFAIALDTSESPSGWLEKNQALVFLRNMRWLNRRLALAHMLRLSAVGAVWERLHRLQAIAEERAMARTVLPVFEGDRARSSVREEYARALLLELATPESLSGREIELVFRIAARTGSAVHLTAERSAEAVFAVVPAGDSRPVLAPRLRSAVPAPLHLNTANCLPRLRAALERDLGHDGGEQDTLFGREFTLRERRAILNRLLEHWGPHPPQRRSRRIEMAAPVRLLCGFEAVAGVVPALEKGAVPDAAEARRELQIRLDTTSRSLNRAKLKAARQSPARLIDASSGGLGIAVRRQDAPWAAHGALVAVLIEPAADWVVGALRRIFSVDDELRLGVQLLAAKPRLLTLRAERLQGASAAAWEDDLKFEASFSEQFQHAILLEPQPAPLSAAVVLLAPKSATRGTQYELQLPRGRQRLRITGLHEDTAHSQRAGFESLGVLP